MKAFNLILSASFIGLGAGCTAPVGSELHVPEDAANTCHAHCHSIGLELSAVAIMANNVGCVCQANSADKATGTAPVGASEAVTGGMATIMLQAEARRRQEEQQRARTHY